jgi:hypothetical protein
MPGGQKAARHRSIPMQARSNWARNAPYLRGTAIEDRTADAA